MHRSLGICPVGCGPAAQQSWGRRRVAEAAAAGFCVCWEVVSCLNQDVPRRCCFLLREGEVGAHTRSQPARVGVTRSFVPEEGARQPGQSLGPAWRCWGSLRGWWMEGWLCPLPCDTGAVPRGVPGAAGTWQSPLGTPAGCSPLSQHPAGPWGGGQPLAALSPHWVLFLPGASQDTSPSPRFDGALGVGGLRVSSRQGGPAMTGVRAWHNLLPPRARPAASC